MKKNNLKFSEMPTFIKVEFVHTDIVFHLSDKNIITIPLSCIDLLKNATHEVRENYKIQGHFIFWDDIDEIIGVKNLLNGTIATKTKKNLGNIEPKCKKKPKKYDELKEGMLLQSKNFFLKNL